MNSNSTDNALRWPINYYKHNKSWLVQNGTAIKTPEFRIPEMNWVFEGWYAAWTGLSQCTCIEDLIIYCKCIPNLNMLQFRPLECLTGNPGVCLNNCPDSAYSCHYSLVWLVSLYHWWRQFKLQSCTIKDCCSVAPVCVMQGKDMLTKITVIITRSQSCTQ